MRRTDGCLNCGEVREMASHGLCFKCYRREKRAGDSESPTVDRHNPGVRREHTKILRGFNRVMAGLGDLGVSKALVLEIRRLIEPYLSPVAEFLAPPEQDKSRAPVNSERNEDENVHRSREPESTAEGNRGKVATAMAYALSRKMQTKQDKK
jgi:hypothetical protein